jgi:hypothetical protein
MRHPLHRVAAAIVLAAVLAACNDASSPAAPADDVAASFAVTGRQIVMLDQCDPASFNQAIGPGTCVGRNGGITFGTFIKLLTKNQTAPSWRFSPDVIHVAHDVTLPVLNLGGEVHTFTEVAEFGGGFVQDLNDLTGNPIPAPECLDFPNIEFIPAGGQGMQAFHTGVHAKFMCCIHPWMRAVTR